MNGIIFLDRDGVINKYPGDFKYVTSLKDFKFIPKAKSAIKKLTNAGFKLFIISNQAGISKGVYPKKVLDDITQKVLIEIKKSGGRIEKALYCIHKEEENCNCRKPKIGLIKQALRFLNNVKVEKMFFVGDTIRDVKTGKSAHCKTILVLSGKEKIKNQKNWEIQPDYIADNLYKAVGIILNS